ncbi:MAG: hypothetical protein R2702_12150 [Acidimicrobiales bacterium]
MQVAAAMSARWGSSTAPASAAAATPRRLREARFAAFVAVTGGTVSAWSARPLADHVDEVRLSGLNGESLRTHRALSTDLEGEELEAVAARCLPKSALRLATRATKRALVDAYRTAYEQVRAAAATPHDAVDTFLLLVQTTQQYGPLDELVPHHRLLPFASARATRAAMLVGGPFRHADGVHHALIRRAEPALARFELAQDRWPEALARFAPDATDPTLAARPTTAPAPAPGRATRPALVASLHRTLDGERRAALEERIADAANPAWELLDREAAVDALGRYDELGTKQRKELFGAATAAEWLGT